MFWKISDLLIFKRIMIKNIHKLDNPVWYSLSEAHNDISINYHNVKFYDPAYCPFGGFIEINNVITSARSMWES